MKKKVITAILLSCVSISCLFGCGEQNTQADNTTDKDKGKYHFEIIVQSYQSSYWQAAALGIQEAAAACHVSINLAPITVWYNIPEYCRCSFSDIFACIVLVKCFHAVMAKRCFHCRFYNSFF